jgi:hypothetical protein
VVYVKRPKRPKLPKGKLVMIVPLEVRQGLLTMAYHTGMKGNYTKLGAMLLTRAVEEYVAGLKPGQKADFQEILENVKLCDSMMKQVIQ